ncbi:FGGY-family carbohydrate kinase [Amycolatopsis sp. NPDC051372]|uniref:FGGY-family carbohydrate kinase n=1 Tax=Amycolatopsis sp. NPDC051372 TaxID=3155669 RepID=UPI0034462927
MSNQIAGNRGKLRTVFLGVDVGTSSTKGVLVDAAGTILSRTKRTHAVDRPAPGHVEMSADIWWDEFCSIATELLARDDVAVGAVGVSGMGPCTLLTDGDGRPLRPAILYGVDSRAGQQIDRINDELGAAAVFERCGSALSSQAVGPKLAWVRENEPDVWRHARRLFMPASWLAYRLTGTYTLDFHSASQCDPLFDIHQQTWVPDWWAHVAPGLEVPPLRWPGDQAGQVRVDVAGIPKGTPVIVGTIDAWTEAISVGAQGIGDLMLMYGTTMFLINTVAELVTSSSMWATVGALPGTRNLAGGMATSGAVTDWFQQIFGEKDYSLLLSEARASPPGARGLLMLPYFAGERTPVFDPDARGVIAGLALNHVRGDLLRAGLEATALGVRHNVEALVAAGGDVRRVVAVGGGTQGGLWTQIVSDVTSLEQVVPRHTVGASYGAAFLAAGLIGSPDITVWNPPATVITPDSSNAELYHDRYIAYRSLYEQTKDISHDLAHNQADASKGIAR